MEVFIIVIIATPDVSPLISTILLVTNPTNELANCNKKGDIPIDSISLTIK